jgi:tRNA (guanine-N7-)-methyltransferase|tara:strand:+ start:33063 stop:33296 length:234 start_codon:yes stop_codon:yes gene_type:complete
MDWATLYPAYAVKGKEQQSKDALQESKGSAVEEVELRVTSISKNVEVADIGCGFGGLLFALAPKFPDTLILGTATLY